MGIWYLTFLVSARISYSLSSLTDDRCFYILSGHLDTSPIPLGDCHLKFLVKPNVSHLAVRA